MSTTVGLLVGMVSLVFGIRAVLTKRVTFGDEGDDYQVWLYGWRAVSIGFLALALAAMCFASIAGLISFGLT